MAAISMFPGLAIIVLLAQVGEVWMGLTTDLSNCNLDNFVPQNMILKDMLHTAGFHMTASTREMVPNTASRYFTMTKANTNKTVMRMGTKVVANESSIPVCKKLLLNFTYNTQEKSLVSEPDKNGDMWHIFVLHDDQIGHMAWMIRIFNGGNEVRNRTFIALVSLDYGSALRAADVQSYVDIMCGQGIYDVTYNFFDFFSADSTMLYFCTIMDDINKSSGST